MISEPSSKSVVWLDGSLVPWEDAKIHISDHHYGIGVFEGVRVYATPEGPKVFRLHDHTARLFRSARIVGIPIPEIFDRERLNAAQLQVLRENQFGDAYLRPFVFQSGFLGLSPRTGDLAVRVAVLALEWKEVESAATARGAVLRTSNFVRSSPNSLLLKAKANANYMNGILAAREARLSGADDAVLLDHNGFVTETSSANLFVVRDGSLFTPPPESILEGITRETIMTLARALSVPVYERRLTRDDLYACDEAFLTGSAVQVAPVREIDGRKIGAGAMGPITERLKNEYAAVVRGRVKEYRHWLTSS